MILACHTLIYSEDAPATRAFLKDVLRWPFATDDESAGDDPAGWLIFRAGPGEVGVHPTAGEGGWTTSVHHELSLMCDDIEATMAELTERGAVFLSEPVDRGFGVGALVDVPGADPILIYQPRHKVAYDL